MNISLSGLSVTADIVGILGFIISIITLIQATKAAQAADAAREAIEQIDLSVSSQSALEKAKILRDLITQNDRANFKVRARDLKDWCIETRHRYRLDLNMISKLDNSDKLLEIAIRDSNGNAAAEDILAILDKVFRNLSEISGSLQQEIRKSTKPIHR